MDKVNEKDRMRQLQALKQSKDDASKAVFNMPDCKTFDLNLLVLLIEIVMSVQSSQSIVGPSTIPQQPTTMNPIHEALNEQDDYDME